MLHQASAEGWNPPGWFVIHQALCDSERGFIPESIDCTWNSGGQHTCIDTHHCLQPYPEKPHSDGILEIQ